MIRNLLGVWKKKELQNNYFVLGSTGAGRFMISYTALQDLIRLSTVGLKSLKRLKSEIDLEPEGLVILISYQLTANSNAEKVFSSLQTKITQAVQQYAGIKVKEVKMLTPAQ